MPLVKTTYFVSPEYISKMTNSRPVTRDDGDGAAWDIQWDERDTFPNWLKENAFPCHYIGRGANAYFAARLMGKNGVFCEIVYDKQFAGSFALSGPYRRFVRIKSQPADRDIPQELSDTLRELIFEAKTLDSTQGLKHFAEKTESY